MRITNEKVIGHILLKFSFFYQKKKNFKTQKTILLFSEFSVFFNFIFLKMFLENNTKHSYMFS